MLARSRITRLAALASALVLGACGSDSTGPGPGPSQGTSSRYTLVHVKTLATLGGGGDGIPVSFVDGSGRTLEFKSGSFTFEEGGEFDLTVNVVYNNSSAYDAGDLGVYTANGGSFALTSTLDDAVYSASVNGDALKTVYKVAGLQFELTFEKD